MTKKEKTKKGRNGWRMATGIVGGIALWAAAVAVVMLLWNWLVPGITGFSGINFWQALGIFVLCRLLTGRLFTQHAHKHAHAHHGKADHWHHMSPAKRREMLNRIFTDQAEDENVEQTPETTHSSNQGA